MPAPKSAHQGMKTTSLNPQRRRICYLHAIYAQNPESAGTPENCRSVDMVTLLFTPMEAYSTFCGVEAIRLGLDLLRQCDLVVAWGLNRQFLPALARSGVEMSLGQVPLLDLDRLIAAESGQEHSFRDVWSHTFGVPEALNPDDHTALFMLGRLET